MRYLVVMFAVLLLVDVSSAQMSRGVPPYPPGTQAYDLADQFLRGVGSYRGPEEFVRWLNTVRNAYHLPPVSHDPALTSWAAKNSSIGFGHYVRGPAAVDGQNAAQTPYYREALKVWLIAPLHREGLLNPRFTRVGIARVGNNWTYLAY